MADDLTKLEEHDVRDMEYTHSICTSCHAMIKDFTTGECAHPIEACVLSFTHSVCTDCGAVKTDMEWGRASHAWFASLEEAKYYETHGRLPPPVIPLLGVDVPVRRSLAYEWRNGTLLAGWDPVNDRWRIALAWNRKGMTPPFQLPQKGQKAFHNEMELGWPPMWWVNRRRAKVVPAE